MTSEDMEGRPLPTPVGQEAFEAQVLEAIMKQADKEPYGAALRARIESRKPVKRQLSGAGFFLELEVDGGLGLPETLNSPLPQECCVDSASGDLKGGCIYFWAKREPGPDTLETFSYFGEWPADVSGMVLTDWAGKRL